MQLWSKIYGNAPHIIHDLCADNDIMALLRYISDAASSAHYSEFDMVLAVQSHQKIAFIIIHHANYTIPRIQDPARQFPPSIYVKTCI